MTKIRTVINNLIQNCELIIHKKELVQRIKQELASSNKRQQNKVTTNIIDEIFNHPEILDIDDGLSKEEDSLLVYAKEFFNKKHFLIQLTPEEFENQELIVGHRFIPFISNQAGISDLNISYDGKKIESKIVKITMAEAEKFLLYLNQDNKFYPQKSMNGLKFIGLDLSDFMEKTHYSQSDFLEIQILDYNSLEIKKFTKKQFSQNLFLFQKYKKEFQVNFSNSLSDFSNCIYFHLFRAIYDTKLLPENVPFPPISWLLHSNDAFRFVKTGELQYSIENNNMEFDDQPRFSLLMTFDTVKALAAYHLHLSDYKGIDITNLLKDIFMPLETSPFESLEDVGIFIASFMDLVLEVDMVFTNRMLTGYEISIIEKILEILQIGSEKIIQNFYDLNLEEISPENHELINILTQIGNSLGLISKQIIDGQIDPDINREINRIFQRMNSI